MSKKERLIKAAKELINNKGYEDLKIEEITKEANVAKGTFYTYFKKKEDIISAITKDSFEKISNEALMKKGNTEEKIQHFLVFSAKEVEKIGIEICRAWLANSIKLENKVGLYDLKFYINKIKDILNSSIEIGELEETTPIIQLTEEIVATYYGLQDIWCITDRKISLSESVYNFCKISLPKILENYKKPSKN